MTLKESIDECMRAWEYYAETGTYCKSDYPPAKNWLSECVFCEYDGPPKKRGCSNCPALGYWGGEDGRCYSGRRPRGLFGAWSASETLEERKLWARRIVWMIWLIREDLIKKGVIVP